ncbi:hypothetical protein PSET11_02226 [Arthrobacter ulcerisalmonis]|uniref:Uncharacterized protein n=1 Tax=Arthrobacter ulcerisalmonis TaxID=2483813 RepID=A0A3P5XG98_9MICC|nr:hypothetical protein [Arthrobacter ulcerisalmonis]VDC29170.1 hypothetical protein PSET11_02226 [Arthrobacter ulcerisalmonis]
MNTNEVWPVMNALSTDKHTLAVQAVTALVEGDPQVVKIIGVQYMDNLHASGLADGLTMGQFVSKILGHQSHDEFTVALLCLAADLMARQRHGVAQTRYEALRRELGPRDL